VAIPRSSDGTRLLLVTFALSLPVARLSFSVPFKFDLALDAVSTELAVEFLGEFVPAELARHVEGNFISCQFTVFNRSLPRLSSLASKRGERSREFRTFQFQLQHALPSFATIPTRSTPCPSAGRIRLLVLSL